MPPAVAVTRDQARDLVEHFGGIHAAARGAGIPRSSLQHYLCPEKRQRAARAYYARNADLMRARAMENYESLDTLGYNRRLLRQRRAKALRRRAKRHERRLASG